MRTRLLAAALGGAALLAGATAAAANAGSVTAGTPTAAAVLSAGRPGTAAGSHLRRLRPLLRRVEHATVVTAGPRGTVVHAAIRGVVTAVSRTSLTVRAEDAFTLTFRMSTASTRVRVRPVPGSGSHPAGRANRPGSPADISRGDHVFAVGRAADKAGAVPTARLVVVGARH